MKKEIDLKDEDTVALYDQFYLSNGTIKYARSNTLGARVGFIKNKYCINGNEVTKVVRKVRVKSANRTKKKINKLLDSLLGKRAKVTSKYAHGSIVTLNIRDGSSFCVHGTDAYSNWIDDDYWFDLDDLVFIDDEEANNERESQE